MNTDNQTTLTSATPELWEAIASAQSKLTNASKDALNPHFKSSYATLAAVLDTVRPVFAQAGLGIVQCPTFDGAMLHLDTIITHKSGGWISSRLSVIPGRTDAQGLGSVITYARRYSLSAMAGISAADDDDDGQAAVHDRKPAPASPPARKKAATPAVDPQRKKWIDGLRDAYTASGITSGERASEILRAKGYLPDGVAVPNLADDELQAAWADRFQIFPQPPEATA